MRLIQNTSLQGHNIPLTTPEGPIEVYLRPKRTVEVPDNYSSKILENLIRRRILRVVRKSEPIAQPATRIAPTLPTRKKR